MSEQRYDPLQFAEWLKSDNTPNGGADLWAASALYDFQIDPNLLLLYKILQLLLQTIYLLSQEVRVIEQKLVLMLQ